MDGQEWRQHRARGLILLGDSGPIVGFGPMHDDDGELVWAKCQTPKPGQLGPEAADRERLTIDELLEALRGPLGA